METKEEVAIALWLEWDHLAQNNNSWSQHLTNLGQYMVYEVLLAYLSFVKE